MNSYSKAQSLRIRCDRALFLELDALSERQDVTRIITTQRDAKTEERLVLMECHGDGAKMVLELLKRFRAQEVGR